MSQFLAAYVGKKSIFQKFKKAPTFALCAEALQKAQPDPKKRRFLRESAESGNTEPPKMQNEYIHV